VDWFSSITIRTVGCARLITCAKSKPVSSSPSSSAPITTSSAWSVCKLRRRLADETASAGQFLSRVRAFASKSLVIESRSTIRARNPEAVLCFGLTPFMLRLGLDNTNGITSRLRETVLGKCDELDCTYAPISFDKRTPCERPTSDRVLALADLGPRPHNHIGGGPIREGRAPSLGKDYSGIPS
jgi:hypothetical protein